jgi:hypothetical protein
MDFHHIAFDGASLGIVFQDLKNALAGIELQPEAVSAFDVALHEQEVLQSSVYEKAENYFDTLTGGECNMSIIPPSPKVPETKENGDYREIIPELLSIIFAVIMESRLTPFSSPSFARRFSAIPVKMR